MTLAASCARSILCASSIRFAARSNQKAPAKARGLFFFCERRASLVAAAEELQQHHEEVDEVEIKRKRAHHRFAAGDHFVISLEIHLLDALRIPGGETREHQDAHDRNHELQSRGLQ